MRLWIRVVIGLAVGLAVSDVGHAQGDGGASIRRQINEGTVGIVTGDANGTDMHIVGDLARSLDTENELRILPILGKGALQSVTDLLYMRGIDVAIVPSDVLAHIQRTRIHPTIEKRLRYVTKLFNEELHVLGGKDVRTIQDLQGKKVGIGTDRSGTAITAQTVFATLGIAVEPVALDPASAFEKLRSGEISAMAYVSGKPTKFFEGLEPDPELAFISLPLTAELLETYLPARIEHADYPHLIAEGAGLDTVAVGTLMAVYNWEPTNERYREVSKFVQAFFDNIGALQEPPNHAKWQDVSLGADVPGWIRFQPAQDWLDAQPPPLSAEELALQEHFNAMLVFLRENDRASAADPQNQRGRGELFRDFLDWRQQAAY